MAPSRASVVAALRLFGSLNAGTPLLIASTPVSAAQPEENARSSRNPPARPTSPCSYADSGSSVRSALSARGRSPSRPEEAPGAHPEMAAMKR
jgi:hypothetical protein